MVMSMSVLAIVSTPNLPEAPNSAPRRIAAELPSATIEVVHFDREGFAAVPYLWVRKEGAESLEAVVADDPKILDVDCLDTSDSGTFYKLRWEVDSPLIHCLLEAGGLILEAQGNVDEWNLKLWFEERKAASTFQDCCDDCNVPLEIKRLSSMAEEYSTAPEHLTWAQREALVLAFERGYFDEPRSISQDELGNELEISTNAVGRRLRRGYRNLIEETLVE